MIGNAPSLWEGRRVYAEERRAAIGQLVESEGRGEVTELATRFDVTPETIRRDLSALEDRGLLRRTHGGAIPSWVVLGEPGLAERTMLRAEQKRRIAEAALAFVPATGTIILDAGTTTAALADALPGDLELTVVTDSVPIASSLASRPGLSVWMVGGRVRGRTQAVVDAWALERLVDLHVDVAFVGTNGCSLSRGLSTPDPAEAEVKRAMCGATRRVVALLDSSKFDQEHAVAFAPLHRLAAIVTDDEVEPELAEQLARSGPEVVRA